MNYKGKQYEISEDNKKMKIISLEILKKVWTETEWTLFK